MKTQLRIAVVSTSREKFERHCRDFGLDGSSAKHVAILRDVQDEWFSAMELIDGHQNVTDYVINNVKVHEL